MLLLLRKRSIIISEKWPQQQYLHTSRRRQRKKGTSCHAKSLQTTHYPHGKMMLIHHGPTSSRKMSLKHARAARIGQWIDSRDIEAAEAQEERIVILPCMERKPSASRRSAISYEIRTKELNCKRGHKAARKGLWPQHDAMSGKTWRLITSQLSALSSRSSLLVARSWVNYARHHFKSL